MTPEQITWLLFVQLARPVVPKKIAESCFEKM